MEVASMQGFELSAGAASGLAMESQRNLRRAILMLETLYVTNGSPRYVGISLFEPLESISNILLKKILNG
jgi:hypothetical protein